MRNEQSISDLHHALGKILAQGQRTLDYRDYSRDVNAYPLEGLQIESVVRKITPPALPDTEEVSALRSDWMQTERLLNAAFRKFTAACGRGHQSKAQLDAHKADYRAECAQIIGRAA